MNIFDLILWPFKWIVSVVLWLFHTLFHLAGYGPGFRPDLGSVHYLPDPGDAYPDHSAVRQAD